jgi:uncharacterized protein YbbK (DUF523 family)
MTTDPKRPTGPVIRLGISACLLGQRVRYDGGHKLDHFLVDTLGQYVEWVPVCPEVEIGLPVPRDTLRLVGDQADPRLVMPKSGADHTDTMKAWARQRLEELAALELCGFVFKKTWAQLIRPLCSCPEHTARKPPFPHSPPLASPAHPACR